MLQMPSGCAQAINMSNIKKLKDLLDINNQSLAKAVAANLQYVNRSSKSNTKLLESMSAAIAEVSLVVLHIETYASDVVTDEEEAATLLLILNTYLSWANQFMAHANECDNFLMLMSVLLTESRDMGAILSSLPEHSPHGIISYAEERTRQNSN